MATVEIPLVSLTLKVENESTHIVKYHLDVHELRRFADWAGVGEVLNTLDELKELVKQVTGGRNNES